MKTNGKIEHGSGLHTTQYEKGILKDSKEQSMGRWQAQALFLLTTYVAWQLYEPTGT